MNPIIIKLIGILDNDEVLIDIIIPRLNGETVLRKVISLEDPIIELEEELLTQ